MVSPPDDLTGVPVADRLAVSQEDVVTIQDDDALVTGDVLSEIHMWGQSLKSDRL